MNADGPSPHRIEIAMSIAMATLSRLRETGALEDEATDEAALLAMLGEGGADVANLLERVVAAALEAESFAEACVQRIDALVTRRQRFEHLGLTWRGVALSMMAALDMKRHRAAEFTATLGDGLTKLVITEEALLPEEYWRITREPNRVVIKDDLKEGVVIPGAELGIGPPRAHIEEDLMAQAVTEYRAPGVGLVPQNLDEALRLATLMASMKGLPDWLHDSVADCLQVVELAMRWQMSPFAVAQCVSIIHGKQMVEGKLVAAVVETSGQLSTHFQYEHDGAGDDRAVTVSATLKGESKPKTIRTVLKDVRTLDKNGKVNRQWTGGQIDQQLCYSGVRTWARRHTPALMLGVYSREEFNAPKDGETFTGMTLEAEAEEAEELAPAPTASARDAINEAVPMPKAPPSPPPPADTAHDRMLDWVEDTLVRIENCATLQALFALIDELRPDRDTLREQAPDLDKRLARAIKIANTRLQPPPDEQPAPLV